MKCYHCSKPAMFQWGDEKSGYIPLCIDCQMKVQSIMDRQLENNERMMNYLAQEIEMTTGLPGLAPRFPERKQPTLISAGGITMNNLSIDRSNIGVLNTGQIGSVDSAIGSLNASGNEGAADAFRHFTEAVVALQEVDAGQKNQIIELLSVLASEATVPEAERRKSAMRPLLVDLANICSGVAAVSILYAQYAPVIERLFS